MGTADGEPSGMIPQAELPQLQKLIDEMLNR